MNTQNSAARKAKEAYDANKINTASRKRLLLMLYEGAVKNLYTAEQELENRNYTVVNDKLVKTQEIIAELMVSLNFSAGEIARNLQRLYDFMYRQLVEANIEKNGLKIVQVRKILEELMSAWKQA